MSLVALVGPVPPWRSGVADQDVRLLRALRRLRLDPLVVTFSRMYPPSLYPGRTDRDPGTFPSDAGEVHALLDGWNPLSYGAAARFLAARDPDLVVVPWWTAFFAMHTLLLLSALRRESPGAVTLLLAHNVRDHEAGLLGGALSRVVLHRVDRVAVQNRHAAAELSAELPGTPVAVVRHPVEPREILPDRDEARARLGIPPDAPLFLFGGILRPYKGWDVLLAAFRRLRRDVPSAHLVFAGEPWGDAGLLREEENVRLRLEYLPERERALWFAASDAVVCPYRHATGSGIAADALAHGRPVIGSRVDGLEEVVEDGVSGVLVPPGDEAALADAMRRFVSERMGPRLSAGAVRRALALGPDAHARQLLALGGVAEP
ncbi:MAG: glycosyltransferase family 4 protein [Thermoanaerobaculia bacterium]